MNSRVLLFIAFALAARGVSAQQASPDAPPPEPTTRTEAIEQAQADKAASLTPAMPDKAEAYVGKISDAFLGGQLHLHPFFHSAYSGGGFTLGAGYSSYVGPKNLLDVRGSLTFSGYKRIESEFIAPDLFGRRGTLDVIGGWREATQVGFFGFGMTSTKEDRVNYSFQQPYASAALMVRPSRNALFVSGALQVTQWNQAEGSGSAPSIETKYTEQTLQGLGASPIYFHTQATVGIDSRPAVDYARTGGRYAVTFHDYSDKDTKWGFQETDYEAIQHIPILRESWVVSLHGVLTTSWSKSGQQIPFFMMPTAGGGGDLRGYTSWRFRDLNSLFIQAEWRVMVNRFLDTAIFYDTGRVAPRLSEMKLNDLKTDVGIGFRFHGPTATPLRIEIARGSDGFNIVFAASSAF